MSKTKASFRVPFCLNQGGIRGLVILSLGQNIKKESGSVFLDYRKQFQKKVLEGMTTKFDTRKVFCNVRLPLIEGPGYSHSCYQEQPGIQDLGYVGTSNSSAVFNCIAKGYYYI